MICSFVRLLCNTEDSQNQAGYEFETLVTVAGLRFVLPEFLVFTYMKLENSDFETSDLPKQSQSGSVEGMQNTLVRPFEKKLPSNNHSSDQNSGNTRF